MKKIINTIPDVVPDMLKGIVLAHPELELLPKDKIIQRKNLNTKKVSLISGGGSGHEPAHAGFVGSGMLDAAVCGDVFASPSQVQVYRAIKSVASDSGVLLIIKNYSGDLMNFQNAMHLASLDGIDVDFVKVDDDIAVEDSLYTVGRRGVAGTIFVHKIAGAAAEKGKSLAEVKAIAEKVVKNSRTLGFALTSCTVPAKGSPTFSLEETEMEYGVGIHGEPGIKREQVKGAEELAERIIEAIDKELGVGAAKSRVALLVNGFGGTPLMELYVLNSFVAKSLLEKGVSIVRDMVGNYMTSLDMAGASVTVLKLDDELEGYLNEVCDTPGLKITGSVLPTEMPNFDVEDVAQEVSFEIETNREYAKVADKLTLQNLIYIIDAMSACIIRNEMQFCELDAHAGDGDFGMSVAKGFRQLKREYKSILAQPDLDIGKFLEACSIVIMEHCGGASGPVWGSAFNAAGRSLRGSMSVGVKDFASALQAAVKGIQDMGERSFGRGAVVGDKTLIDALAPCADVWSNADDSTDIKAVFRKGAEAAVQGAKNTENIVARMGRAGTVGERSLGHPDAGAHALGVIFTEIAGLLE